MYVVTAQGVQKPTSPGRPRFPLLLTSLLAPRRLSESCPHCETKTETSWILAAFILFQEGIDIGSTYLFIYLSIHIYIYIYNVYYIYIICIYIYYIYISYGFIWHIVGSIVYPFISTHGPMAHVPSLHSGGYHNFDHPMAEGRKSLNSNIALEAQIMFE